MRDHHVHKIKKDGVFQWRKESGYYQQSKVENTFYRYKKYWDESFEQEVKEIAKWKRLLDVISSTGSSKMNDINQSLLLDI